MRIKSYEEALGLMLEGNYPESFKTFMNAVDNAWLHNSNKITGAVVLTSEVIGLDTVGYAKRVEANKKHHLVAEQFSDYMRCLGYRSVAKDTFSRKLNGIDGFHFTFWFSVDDELRAMMGGK